MSKIYAAFSNPDGDLEQVTTEFSALFNFFNSKEIKQKVDFGFVLNATVDTLTSDIVAGQKDIRVFLFSGHSGGSGLDFGEADFASDHLIRFFNTISSDDSKIDCVILNGCDNAEIVRRLSHVPVVIGTKSEINDDVAQKFTYDFFRTLIESETSYKQAFVDAIASQDNISSSIHTRSEGGGDVPAETRLNDYFLYINNEKTAEEKFPFKKMARNWTKYLFLLFLIVAVLLVYLFRHPIEQMWRGYSCAVIHNSIDKTKCNFVVADFTTDQSIDFTSWLFNNVRESSDIRNYLNCINIGTFGNVIKNNALDRDSLPHICGYDFNLTGSFTKDREKLRAEFNIFPYDPDQLSSSTFVYHVESLGNLDTLITFLDPGLANQFVLFELCASCAVQKGYKNILPAMVALLDGYKYDTATAPSYQRLQQRLSDAALHAGDTVMALKALDQVAAARQNDFALWALEEKTKIYEVQQDIPNQYIAQTAYLEAMELRVRADTSQVAGGKGEKYAKASQEIRYNRAQLVTKNDDVLKEKQPEAIRDYQKLDHSKYKGKKYADEIKVLKEKQGSAFNAGAVGSVNEATLSTSALTENENVKISTVHGFMQPAVLLHQPALVDPGEVSKLNTGFVMEQDTIEQLTVVVLTHPKEQKVFQQMTSRLKDFGYVVDEKRSNMNLDENNILFKDPTVIFYNKEMKVKAYHLARMLSKEYSKEFQVLPAEKLSGQKNFLKDPTDVDLVVYWE